MLFLAAFACECVYFFRWFFVKKSRDLNHSGLLISNHLLYNNMLTQQRDKAFLYTFNQFQYLFNDILLNKQNTDSHIYSL